MEERNYKLYVHISPSGKRYYGITCRKRVQDRWKNGKGYSKNEYFTRAINKYSWDNFKHIVLFNNLTKEEACLLEQMYIALYDTTNYKYGYNNSLGGEHGLHSEQTKKKMSEDRKGRQFTEETKKKISESMKGRQLTEETKNKLSESAKGRQLTEKTKKKLSEAHKGKVPWNKGITLTEETKKKMSESNKGENNHNYGKPRSEQTKKKISEALKGYKHNEQAKKKMSESKKGENNPNYGKPFTEEHKKKISEALKGKPLTEEHKKNMSEALKGKNNPNSKPVLMFTKEGEFIRKFDCVADANEYLDKNRNNTSIYLCASGISKTAYGYIWKYEEQEQEAS